MTCTTCAPSHHHHHTHAAAIEAQPYCLTSLQLLNQRYECICIPLFHLAAVAHRAGLKVVMSGLGADELIRSADEAMYRAKAADRVPRGLRVA